MLCFRLRSILSTVRKRVIVQMLSATCMAGTNEIVVTELNRRGICLGRG